MTRIFPIRKNCTSFVHTPSNNREWTPEKEIYIKTTTWENNKIRLEIFKTNNEETVASEYLLKYLLQHIFIDSSNSMIIKKRFG